MKVTVKGTSQEIYVGDSYQEAKEKLTGHFKANYIDSPILESEVCVDVKTDIEVYIIQDDDGGWDTYIIEVTYT